MDNQSLSHTKWKCQYHIVWIPKYRQKKLYGVLRQDIREIIKTLCQYKQVELIAGVVCTARVSSDWTEKNGEYVDIGFLSGSCLRGKF